MFMHDKANKESHIFKKLRQIQQLLKIGEKNFFLETIDKKKKEVPCLIIQNKFFVANTGMSRPGRSQMITVM